MTGEEVEAKIAKLLDKRINLSMQREKYAKYIAKEQAKVQSELDKLQKQCPHKDDGGMFYAVCEYCGFVDS